MRLDLGMAWVATVVTTLLAAGPSRAAGPLGPRGAAIETSDYAIDFSEGVFIGSSRAMGLGGAYVGIGEGVDGAQQNAAAPAVRRPWSYAHIDYDWSASLYFTALFADHDFYNSGREARDASSDFFSTAGVGASIILQWGRWGVGLRVDGRSFGISGAPDGTGRDDERLDATFVRTRLQMARMFGDHVVAGVGIRGTTLSIEEGNEAVFSTGGTAFEVGALWRPVDWPVRVGAAYLAAVDTTPDLTGRSLTTAEGDVIVPERDADPGQPAAGALYLPRRVVEPGRWSVGVALQLGPRPFNPRWTDPDRALDAFRRTMAHRRAQRSRSRQHDRLRAPAAERARLADLDSEAATDRGHQDRVEATFDRRLRRRVASLPRQYVLITADVDVTMPVADAVGVESFLQRRVDRSGERITATPRIGVETEAIPHWLKVRGGGYLEATRFSSPDASERPHGTLGFDLRLFPWDVWGLFSPDTVWLLTGAVDLAPRYLGWTATVSLWR